MRREEELFRGKLVELEDAFNLFLSSRRSHSHETVSEVSKRFRYMAAMIEETMNTGFPNGREHNMHVHPEPWRNFKYV